MSENRIKWLYSLRDEELLSLEKLDVARNTYNPGLQMEALNELQRIYIDFAFSEYLIYTSDGQYRIDYKYFSDWKNEKSIKTIQGEIEKEEANIKAFRDAEFERRYGYSPS